MELGHSVASTMVNIVEAGDIDLLWLSVLGLGLSVVWEDLIGGCVWQ